MVKEKFPKEILDYLVGKNKTLRNDYLAPDGHYAENCFSVAFEAAEILVQKGRRPYLSECIGKNWGRGNHETLFPLPYNRRVRWGGHMICCCDGWVFDPMFTNPVRLAEYAKKAFGREVIISIFKSENEIEAAVREMLKRKAANKDRA